MRYTIQFSILACVAFVVACSPAKGDRTGHEYMPDMTHTTGYEANLYDYYYYNRWGTEAEYKQFASPRTSVPGTVARGQISVANAADGAARMDALAAFSGIAGGSMAMTPNGSVPYYYTDTEEERARATREITRNPFPITEAGLAHGKELYVIYCGICHGDKGDGLGYLVREEDPAKGIVAGVYPAAPANFMLDTFVNSSVGRFYHGIMYGRNVMGSYADKLSYQERWEVIHYIRSLQAQSKKAEYSAKANTFNSEATSWATMEASMKHNMAVVVADTAAHPASAGEQQHTNQH
jgi:mono/diheme cytochrome c family protein